MNCIYIMDEKNYLEAFEKRVKKALLLPFPEMGGCFLETEDLMEQWERLKQEYVADAIMQITDYPEVSVAWAAYLGMAIAELWDRGDEEYKQVCYTDFYGSQGFDDMDDYIVTHYLRYSLESDEAREYTKIYQMCGRIATNCIRREQIPPQSPLAYHCFIVVCRLMFTLGASLRLKHLGYALHRVDL